MTTVDLDIEEVVMDGRGEYPLCQLNAPGFGNSRLNRGIGILYQHKFEKVRGSSSGSEPDFCLLFFWFVFTTWLE